MVEKIVGNHIIVDVVNCNPDKLNDEEFIRETLLDAAIKGGAGILGIQSYKFEPQGVTAVVMLSESHENFHSWPELGSFSMDCYTCGDHVNTKLIVDTVVEAMDGDVKNYTILKRGF
jgi:S-adenosylmethionine decarboxylase